MFRLVLTLTSLLSAAVCLPAVTNLIQDPGFEDKSWSLTSWEVCESSQEYTPEAHTGEVAIKLTGLKAGKDGKVSALAHSQPIDVEAGQDYLFSLWLRTEGDPKAQVSFITYKEPFAEKGFKTPQAMYNTRALWDAPAWQVRAIRYKIPPQAVQMIIIVRAAGLGTVWYDDLSLALADQARIEFPLQGEITRLPDLRRFKAQVQLPPEGRYQIELASRQSGKTIATETISSPETIAELSGSAQDTEWLDALVVEPHSRAVLAHCDFQASPLADFTPLYPRYRHAMFASDARDYVSGRLTINATAQVTRRIMIAAGLQGDSILPQHRRWKRAQRQQELRVPFHPGAEHKKWSFTVSARTPEKTYEFVHSFRVKPPAPQGTHEIIVGENNELLLDGKPFFVRGFYGGGPEDYGPVVKAGYNAAFNFSASPKGAIKFLDGLQKIGMLGCVGLPVPFVKKGETEGLREAIRRVKNHPALLGYYLIDEPVPYKQGTRPEDLQPFYDILADEDPYHPVMTALWSPEFADDFENCLDILMFDPYPLSKNRRPLKWVAQVIRRARRLLGDRKPVFQVPQAFGWEKIEGLEPPFAYTTPTPAQERCMTYLGLAAGARGLVYYCYHVYVKHDKQRKEKGQWPWIGGGFLPEREPELWGSLVRLGRDLDILAPALCRGGSREWVQGDLHLREIAPTKDQPGFLLAVNANEHEPSTAEVVIASLQGRGAKLEEITGSTPVEATDGRLSLQLQPMEVRIYKLPPK